MHPINTSLKGDALRWFANVANLHGLTGGNTRIGQEGKENREHDDGEPKALEIACLRDCTLGQDRGVAAFRFGMAMTGRGYNIFVTGPSVVGGTGGTARIDTLGIVKNLLKQGIEKGKKNNIPEDLCCVHNFVKVDEPTLLRFKAGTGKQFKEDVRSFLDSVMREIPFLFENPEYTAKKNHITENHEHKSRELFNKLEGRVRDAGFAIINMQAGGVQRPDIAPLIDGEPVALRKLEELQGKGEFLQVELEGLQATYAKLKDEIDAIFLEVREVQREKKRDLSTLDTTLFQKAIRELAHNLFAYTGEKVQFFVEGMLCDLVERLEQLRQAASDSFPLEKGDKGPQMLQAATARKAQFSCSLAQASCPAAQASCLLSVYEVNILVDNSALTGPPVIFESYPTYRNLFGSLECTAVRPMDPDAGQRAKQSGCRKIYAGSLLKANGGYLVINLRDAIAEVGVWATLKRALKNQSMEIQTFDPYHFVLSPNIKPEPIEINVKVIVLATPQLYHLLRHHDDDVERVFKVWADFDASMNFNDAALQHVRQCMQGIVYEEGLLPFAPSAVATLLELGVRHAGRREKISIAFPQLRDIMEEANYMALMRDSGDGFVMTAAETVGASAISPLEVTSSDVEAALQARRYREGQVEEKMQDMIERGTILIDTKGLAVGQVNGLAVLSIGDHHFGKPSRITATTAMGKAGLVNIEHEAALSGSLHTKGVLILMGYMNRMFGQKWPLVLSASIAFEQSYGGVDGDSASSTEMYALLSSLSGVPIKQGIAVTGSMNQMGEVQAIGGVNEKIEGFYDCCVQTGLTGEQGVMIPRANMQDLMLDVRVVEAVERGNFHVWAVNNIAEGIEILTDFPSGVREEVAGTFGFGGIAPDIEGDRRSIKKAEKTENGTSDHAEEGTEAYAKDSIFAKVNSRLKEMSCAFYERRENIACNLG